MTTAEIYKVLHERYSDYEEGAELGDIIGSLCDAAHTSAGLGMYSVACRLLLTVRDMIYEDLTYRIQENGINTLTEKEKELWKTDC